jgi:hypothetical protein
MRNIAWLLLIVFFISCRVGQHFGPHTEKDTVLIAKAQHSLQIYLGADTSNHYSPISFGDLDSLFQSYAETPEGMASDSLAEYYENLQVDSMGNQALSDEYGKKASDLRIDVQNKMATYEGPWIGWIIVHKYNTRDIVGVPMVDERLYRLNKDFTVKGIVEDPLREIGN